MAMLEETDNTGQGDGRGAEKVHHQPYSRIAK